MNEQAKTKHGWIRIKDGDNKGRYFYAVHTQNGQKIKPSIAFRGEIPAIRKGDSLIEVVEDASYDEKNPKYMAFIFSGKVSEDRINRRIESFARCSGAEEIDGGMTLCRGYIKCGARDYTYSPHVVCGMLRGVGEEK